MSTIVYRQDCSMRSFKKATRHVCIFYFSSVKYQFYIHFQNKHQLGGSSTRPLIGSSPLDPTGRLPTPRIPFPLCQSIPPKLPSRWRHWAGKGRHIVWNSYAARQSDAHRFQRQSLQCSWTSESGTFWRWTSDSRTCRTAVSVSDSRWSAVWTLPPWLHCINPPSCLPYLCVALCCHCMEIFDYIWRGTAVNSFDDDFQVTATVSRWQFR